MHSKFWRVTSSSPKPGARVTRSQGGLVLRCTSSRAQRCIGREHTPRNDPLASLSCGAPGASDELTSSFCTSVRSTRPVSTGAGGAACRHWRCKLSSLHFWVACSISRCRLRGCRRRLAVSRMRRRIWNQQMIRTSVRCRSRPELSWLSASSCAHPPHSPAPWHGASPRGAAHPAAPVHSAATRRATELCSMQRGSLCVKEQNSQSSLSDVKRKPPRSEAHTCRQRARCGHGWRGVGPPGAEQLDEGFQAGVKTLRNRCSLGLRAAHCAWPGAAPAAARQQTAPLCSCRRSRRQRPRQAELQKAAREAALAWRQAAAATAPCCGWRTRSSACAPSARAAAWACSSRSRPHTRRLWRCGPVCARGKRCAHVAAAQRAHVPGHRCTRCGVGCGCATPRA
jgi:hypothetical protein